MKRRTFIKSILGFLALPFLPKVAPIPGPVVGYEAVPVPKWNEKPLRDFYKKTSEITGTLPITNGGTGIATFEKWNKRVIGKIYAATIWR